MGACEKAYLACGYQSKRSRNDVAVREARKLSFSDGLDELRRSRDFFVKNDEARKARLGYHAMAGPGGAPCSRTVVGLDLSVDALGDIKTYLSSTPALHAALDKAKLSAFTNESPVERGFGEYVLYSQTDNPTQQQYSNRKWTHIINTIRKYCRNKFWWITGVWTQYQEVSKSDVDAERVVDAFIDESRRAAPPPLTTLELKQLKPVKNEMLMCARFAKAGRTMSVRNKYKGRAGFQPSMLMKTHSYSATAGGQRHLSLYEALSTLDKHAHRDAVARTGRIAATRNSHAWLVGDVVFVRPEKHIDRWWAAHPTAALGLEKATLRRLIRVFWLERWEGQDATSRDYVLSKNREFVLFGNLLKDKDGAAITIPCAGLESRWMESSHIYSFEDDFVEHLGERALAHDDNYKVDRPVWTRASLLSYVSVEQTPRKYRFTGFFHAVSRPDRVRFRRSIVFWKATDRTSLF